MRKLTILLMAACVLGLLAAPSPAAARPCQGTVKEKVNGKTIRAGSIKTRNTSCRAGRRVIRSFLRKADDSRRCNRRSKRPPPTTGCRVRGFNCFRNGNTYCASPSSKEVSWKE